MVQAHTQPESAWGVWFDREIMDSLRQSMSEVPETARALQDLAVWAGSWSWSQYSIEQLGQPYRMIQLAAELMTEKHGQDEHEAMRIAADCLAGFDSDSEREAGVSPFVRCVIDVCGTFDRQEIAQLRDRGFEEQEIAEIAGAVALSLFISLLTNTADEECPRLRHMAHAG
ncbi:MAG: hypothetical protein ACX94C_01310 [Phycisphaerales bacterium]